MNGLISFNDLIKFWYPLPDDHDGHARIHWIMFGTAWACIGLAMRERFAAPPPGTSVFQIESLGADGRRALGLGLIDARGRVTGAGREALRALGGEAAVAAEPHDDNTGAPCRSDLAGHDCCLICNTAEEALAVASAQP